MLYMFNINHLAYVDVVYIHFLALTLTFINYSGANFPLSFPFPSLQKSQPSAVSIPFFPYSSSLRGPTHKSS